MSVNWTLRTPRYAGRNTRSALTAQIGSPTPAWVWTSTAATIVMRVDQFHATGEVSRLVVAHEGDMCSTRLSLISKRVYPPIPPSAFEPCTGELTMQMVFWVADYLLNFSTDIIENEAGKALWQMLHMRFHTNQCRMCA